MARWQCPHCGAPQAEASRCWVCHRSSTTCSTCRHFRRSLASDVGYCGLDPRRAPLTGLELRGCWTSPVALADPPRPAAAAGPREARPARRTFIPLDAMAASSPLVAGPEDAAGAVRPGIADPLPAPDRVTLFDLDA